ncbi:hypothetical protein SASPL_119753 [Salvia splendens]|uniref:Copper transport protein n=1 Tax=Salvia splendens TaxID=180675 RepID=A0A8X8XND3_SALSN|nr:hypothetical protein SASPL_119753 [Salvia splendens]
MEGHMTFSLGDGSENLYINIVDLAIVFMMSLLVEWMSHTTYLSNFSDEHNVRLGLIQTGFYIVRMVAAYIVMLAVMSFDARILSVAVAGYTLGFLLFGSGVFDHENELGYHKASDLPPLSC